nr:hypothetical protein [Tanacetum cinerariifolium]
MWLLSLQKAPAALMNLMLLIVFLLLQAIFLRHKVAMLSMRVKRFYKKTGRKLEFNGKNQLVLTKPRLSVLTVIEEETFFRDYRSAMNSRNRSRDARNAGYRGRDNGKRPAKKEDKKALVVQDGLGTYDWSYQVEEEATDFALMTFTSNPSSSSSSNYKIQHCSKQCA